ncbi:hypothetical protein JYU34_001352 [Plutella xylostella]|uniref:Uncharacterized protein n=1 Tax=Plutella xylostella TaxID=51655 RepID=A0ABQ7R3P7_PLUXY|nr:hypothetical protein JYU34_001352 [Plutella xylostella]
MRHFDKYAILMGGGSRGRLARLMTARADGISIAEPAPGPGPGFPRCTGEPRPGSPPAHSSG